VTPDADLEALKDRLESYLQDSLNVPGGTEPVLEDLFSESFMQENSEFVSLDDFLKESPVTYEESASVPELLDGAFDDFARKTTEFGSWQAMRQQAEVNWMNNHLA
jgi:hypothetical protein